MKRARPLALAGAVGLVLGLLPGSTAAQQADPTDPCDPIQHPESWPEFYGAAHESFLQEFCDGEVQGDALRALGVGLNPTGGSLGPIANDEPENTLVNNRGDDTAPHITESETSIDSFDSDGDGVSEDVVMAWNGAVGGTHGMGVGFSSDNGDTWTDLGLLANPAGFTNCCDPAVAVASDGTFYVVVLTFNNGTGAGQLAISTFTPPAAPSVPAIIPGLINVDREDMAVDNTGTAGTDGNIYACYAEFGAAGVPVRFVRSTDGGTTWSTPVDLVSAGEGGQACRVEVGAGGEVFVAWHRTVGAANDMAEIHIRRCTPGVTECADIGEWSADTVIDTVTRAQDAAAAAACGRPALNGFVRKTFENPTIAINRTTGRVHVAYSFRESAVAVDDADIRYQALNPNLTVAIAPIQLNVDGTDADQWRPFLAVTDDGSHLAVAWYSRQLDAANNLLFDVFKRVSSDDGASFGAEERVTTVSSDVPPLLPNFDPDVVNCYMSDYETMDANAGSFHIGWSDNRELSNGTPDPDVRYLREAQAQADLEIVSFDALDPPPEMLIGDEADVTLRKVITNNGPAGPVDVRVTKTATADPGASVDPAGDSFVEPALGVGEDRTVDEVFTIGCQEPGSHTFAFTNEIRSEDPGNADPNPANNSAVESFTVDCIVPVKINIKPGDFPNSINLRSSVPVAVLTTAAGEFGLPVAFDATTIDPLSVRFGPAAVVNAGGGASEFHGQGHIEDSVEPDETTRDGDLDMVLHFRAGESGLATGDTEACVRGEFTDPGGGVFLFFGCDSVSIVP